MDPIVSPQAKGHQKVEHFQVSNGRVEVLKLWDGCSIDPVAPNPPHACKTRINKELVIIRDGALKNFQSAIKGGKEGEEPMQILEKLLRELNLALTEIVSKGSKHTVNKDPSWLNDLMQVHELTQEGLKFSSSKMSFSADLQTFSIYFLQFILFNAKGIGVKVKRNAQAF